MRIRTTLVVLLALPCSIVAAQLSAFGAGNLNSSAPYGLSADEKAIYANKKEIENIKKGSFSSIGKITSLRERVDGLQTIVEGIGQTTNANKASLKTLSQNFQNFSTDQSTYREKLKKIIDNNIKNITQMQQLLQQTSVLLKSVNEDYVSKAEFNKLVGDINAFKKLISKEMKSRAKSRVSSVKKLSTAKVYKEAYAAYLKKNYVKASKNYRYTISKHYMPATSNFMLGEISYKKFDYADAIAYYKKSAMLYSKSKFMPTLMLHSAIAMKRTKDIANSKKFLNALIAKYPASKEAAEAKKILKALK